MAPNQLSVVVDMKNTDEFKSLAQQIEKLANFIMEEIPGEPSQSEGAVDCAIRIMRERIPQGA